jgi:hypothetical protein
MEKQYLSKLSEDVKSKVYFIEKHIQSEIKVTINSNLRSMACLTRRPVTIITPSEQYFNSGSVLHELLHIKRILLNDVPVLDIADDENDSDKHFKYEIESIDNNIEHLFIIPIEIDLMPNRKDYWRENIGNTFLEKYTEQNKSSSFFKCNLFLLSMLVDMLFNEDDDIKFIKFIEREYAFDSSFYEFKKKMFPIINANKKKHSLQCYSANLSFLVKKLNFVILASITI